MRVKGTGRLVKQAILLIIITLFFLILIQGLPGIPTIQTDKVQYIIGETVSVTVTEANTNSQNLYYEYEGFTQRYMGDYSSFSFAPVGIGTHYLVLRDKAGNELTRISFEVIAGEEQQPPVEEQPVEEQPVEQPQIPEEQQPVEEPVIPEEDTILVPIDELIGEPVASSNEVITTIVPSLSPGRFDDITLTVSDDSLEKYFTINKERINLTTWRLRISVSQDLLQPLRSCYNNITQIDTYGAEKNCDISELIRKHLPGKGVSEQKLKDFIGKSRKIPISVISGSGYSNVNSASYLDGEFEVYLTFLAYGTEIKIGLGTIFTSLPGGSNAQWHSAYDETTYTQDGGSTIYASDSTCINQTNTSNDARCNEAQGDASDDPYFAQNITLPAGNVNWVWITAEGMPDAASSTCNLGLWNFSGTPAYKTVATSACANTADTTLSFNITGTNLTYFVSNNIVKFTFALSSGGADDLNMDYMAAIISYNSSLNFSTPTTNDSDVYIGDSVNHTVDVQTGTGSTLANYTFSWNASGASCGAWANVTIGALSGATATIGVVQTIPTACEGKTIGWRIYANNSDSIVGNSSIHSYLAKGIPPTITLASVNPRFAMNGSVVNISATVTDDISVGTVVARIYYPNGTSAANYSMTNNSGSTTYWNASYIANFSIPGQYNVTIYATDGVGTSNTALVNFTPIINLTSPKNITVDGTLTDWSGVTAVGDAIGDSGSGASVIDNELVIVNGTAANGVFKMYVYESCDNVSCSPVNITDVSAGQNSLGFVGAGDFDNDSVVEFGMSYRDSDGVNSTVQIWDYVAGSWVLSFNTTPKSSIGVYSFSSGDVDGDGVPEFLSCDAYRGNDTLWDWDGSGYVLLDKGDHNSDYSSLIYDLNNDSVGEMIFCGSTGNGLMVYNLSSSKKFNSVSNTSLTTVQSCDEIDVGFIDGDSFPDLVVCGPLNVVDWYEWNGTQFTFVNAVTTSTNYIQGCKIGHTDNGVDGYNEVVVSALGLNITKVMNWTGSGWVNVWNSSNGYGGDQFKLAVGDLNGDGLDEFTGSYVPGLAGYEKSGLFGFNTSSGSYYMIRDFAANVTLRGTIWIGDIDGDSTTGGGGGGSSFDIANYSLAHNSTYLFAKIAVNGTIDLSDATNYYAVYISHDDVSTGSGTSLGEASLGFNYDVRMQVNGTACAVYDYSSNNLGACYHNNNSNTLEIRASFSNLQVAGIGANVVINVSFETGTAGTAYDSAPDSNSFVKYNATGITGATAVTINSVTVPSRFVINNTPVNMSADISTTGGTSISNVEARILYPNGTSYINITMNSNTGTTYYNDTFKATFMPIGNYTFAVYAVNNFGASDVTGYDYNYTPILNLSNQTDIVINGAFTDWSDASVPVISDAVGDAGSGAVTPHNELLITGLNNDPSNMTIFRYNSTSRQYVSIWTNTSSGVTLTMGGGAFGDVTHDNKTDFVIARNNGNAGPEVWTYNSTSAKWYKVWSNYAYSTDCYIGGIDDYNNDTYNEFFIMNKSGGFSGYSIWGNSSSNVSSFSSQANVKPGTCATYYIPGSGDLNGNGIPELIFQCATNGPMLFYEWNGTNNTYSLQQSIGSGNWSTQPTGDVYDCSKDLNRDTLVDCTMVGNGGRSIVVGYVDGNYRVLYNSSNGSLPSAFTQAGGSYDVTNDGYADFWDASISGVRVFSHDGSDFYSLWNSSTANWGDAASIGAGRAGDSDNDGKGEIIIPNCTSSTIGTIFIYENDTSNSATSFNNTYTWNSADCGGANGQAIIIADLDQNQTGTGGSGGGNNYDIANYSLAHNSTYLFARIAVNGSIDFSTTTNYYALYLSVNDSTTGSQYTASGGTLPFLYDYRIQVNNSNCTIYNYANITIGLCNMSNSTDTIELRANLTQINMTTGSVVNITFETGGSSSFDMAPNYNSFLQYSTAEAGPPGNHAPTLTAYNTSPEAPTTTDDLKFNITCTDSDVSDTITAYLEIFNGTKSYQNYSTTVTSGTNALLVTLANANTNKGENWNATYICGDGTVNTTKSADNVTILNTAPTNPSSLSSNTVNVTATITATCGGSSDADSDSITYNYLFYNVNDTTVRQAWSTTNTYAAQVSDAHDWINVTCKATTTDANSTGNYTNTSVVDDSHPTNPTSLSLSPVNVSSTLTATCGGSTDADSDSITYNYLFYNVNDTTVRQNWGSTNTYVVLAADAHDVINVSCRATTTYENSSTNYTNSTSVDDSHPSTPTSLGLNAVNLSGTLTASCGGSSDADSDSITYNYLFYNVNDSNIRQDWSTTNTYVIQATDVHDRINVSCKATTGYENSTNFTNYTNVDDTHPTNPTSLSLSPVNVSSTLTAGCGGSTDADSDSITYNYLFYNVNDTTVRQNWGSTNTYVVLAADAHDVINVSCRATTIYENSSTNYTNSTNVDDSHPSNPTSLSLSPVNVSSTLTATCGGSSDADSDSITYNYYFYNLNDTSELQAWSNDNTYVIQASDAHDRINVTCKATTGYENSSANYTNTSAVDDTHPSIPTSLGLTAVNVSSTLTATCGGSSDADSDSITYNYLFYNNNDSAVRQDWGTTNTYVIQASDAHDKINVTCKATTSYENGTNFTNSTNVDDSHPTNPTSLSLSAVNVSSTLTAGCGGSTDADGDSITYDYYFYNLNDSSELQAWGSDNTYVVQSTDAHNWINVTCKATTGYENSSSNYTNTSIVDDSHPTTPTSLSLSAVNVSSTLTAGCGGSTDADSDSITYNYLFYNVNDTTVRQNWASTNTYTVQSTDAHNWINVTCKATTVYENSSGNYTNTSIVDDSHPSLPTLDQPPDLNITPDSTPYFNWTASTDADGDTITYAIQIDDDSGFGSVDQSDYAVATNAYTASTLTDKAWYWHIKAITIYENTSYTTYRTLTIDTTAPVISAITNDSITATGARINWTTDEAANSSVKYGKNTGLSEGEQASSDLITKHSISLSSLSENSLYYYNITTCDAYAHCNMSGPYNFTTLSSNSAPAIDSVDFDPSPTPIAEDIRHVQINFTVTDTDGKDNLNHSSAKAKASLGSITRTGNCSNNTIDSDTVKYNCSVPMQYYDPAGSWAINVSVWDLADTYANSTENTFDFGELLYISLSSTVFGFGEFFPGDTNQAALSNPLQIDNMGNVNLSQINITAYNLVNGSYIIGASNITVNVSDAPGIRLQNNSMIAIPYANVSVDLNGVDANESLYFYISIPAVPALNYSSSNNWVISAGN